MPLRVLSLGAGVQSTTLALMAAAGELGEMPDCAIFADTGAEPAATYEHLHWLMSGNVLPFPVHIVSAGNLRDDITGQRGYRTASARPPFFVRNKQGGGGMLNRQCTRDYKLRPIRKKVMELAGIKPRSRPHKILVEQWIGISLDEAIRAKPSRDKWCEHRFPLLEHMINRRQCLAWLEAHGYPRPPKSACTFCPYRDNDAWRRMRDFDPDSWADAIAVDKVIRQDMAGVHKGQVFVHRSLKPLDEVDLSTPEERGQLNLFLNECEGMCGV